MIAPLGNLSFLSLDNLTYTNSQGNSPTQVNAMPAPVIHESVSMSIFNSDSSVSLNNQNSTRMPPTSQNNASSSDQESETENFHKRKINDITHTPHNSESDEPDVKPAYKKMRKN